MAAAPRTLCIDIGGTGIKTLVVDGKGKPLTERLRLETPRPATPRAVVAAVSAMARRQGAFERVSAGFPGVVRRGVIETAFNLHPSWIGVSLDRLLTRALRRPVRCANDADVQGLGAVRGKGVELVITLGTGFGSALFTDGRLVPNVQLGHHAAWGRKTYEEELGNAALKRVGRKKWNRRLHKAVDTLWTLFSYDRLYIGGGNAERVRPPLPARARVISNLEGLLGGVALWESSGTRRTTHDA